MNGIENIIEGEENTPSKEIVLKQEQEDNGNDESSTKVYDLSKDFLEIFGTQAEFDSWDEFSTTLEVFSKKTGFYYKPRSACTVEYLNEKRVNSPIPDRFVYAKVKMICVHYGDPPVSKNNPLSNHKKGFMYVSKGCEAFMQVSYNKSGLKIGKSNHVHKNHLPRQPDDSTPLRNLRSFTFTEDLDILIAREVLKSNPFELSNGEKRWIHAVEILKGEDTRLSNLTPRLVKKRIRFLIDKFVAISHGRTPSVEDEMGQILYELNMTKRERLDNPPGKGRKRKSDVNAKLSFSSSMLDNNSDLDFEEFGKDEQTSEDVIPAPMVKKRKSSPSSQPLSPTEPKTNSELSAFISYLTRKDEGDRKLRMQELELTREELMLRKRELDFQKQRFEFEKTERKAHIDLLKAQMATLEKNAFKQEVVVKERQEHPVEYTIVLDNQQHAVVS